jgi:hypothetical protein
MGVIRCFFFWWISFNLFLNCFLSSRSGFALSFLWICELLVIYEGGILGRLWLIGLDLGVNRLGWKLRMEGSKKCLGMLFDYFNFNLICIFLYCFSSFSPITLNLRHHLIIMAKFDVIFKGICCRKIIVICLDLMIFSNSITSKSYFGVRSEKKWLCNVIVT